MKESAKELNDILYGSVAYPFLSKKGLDMYFPKGIVAQAAQAGEKAKFFNATVGLATEKGEPFCLSDIYEQFVPGSLRKAEVFSYAPGGGDKELRALWKADMVKKNPHLDGKPTSGCLVTSGLTHTISIIANLFAGEGTEVVCPDLFWDNYELVFEDLAGARLRLFSFFNAKGGFNTEAMKNAMLSAEGDTARVILNFPNNPTGYSPSKSEREEIVKALKEVAKAKKVLVILDDAYYGLFYEDETEKESLFAYLADADENIFAIKGDAATKEEMVWGFRIGFITYASKGLSSAQLDALEKKTLGAIRCTVSNCDRPGQSLLLKALKNEEHRNRDKAHLFSVVGERYEEIKSVLSHHKDDKFLTPYPFNSGYFMAFSTNGRSAEELRVYLLDKYQVGVINILGHTIRLAYCSVEKEKIKELVDLVYRAAEELWA